jgi:hypothetical protein
VEAICNFRVSDRQPEFWWPESGRTEKPAMYSEVDKWTSLPLRLSEFGSVFVVFRPDKQSETDWIVKVDRNGNAISNDIGSYIQIVRNGKSFENLILISGQYTLHTVNNLEIKIKDIQIPEPVKIVGPWDVYFSPNWGAPSHVQFQKLISWSEYPDEGVRFFSGKATYRKKIQIPEEFLKEDYLVMLDLGEVEVMSIVKLNGKDLGILWKKPFRIDITKAAKKGENDLELTVVNLWPNRLIGDEHLPDDCNWPVIEGNARKPVMQSLKKYPQWLLDGKPSPTGRFTFSIIKVWSKDDALRKSGLLGPVWLHVVAKVIS